MSRGSKRLRWLSKDARFLNLIRFMITLMRSNLHIKDLRMWVGKEKNKKCKRIILIRRITLICHWMRYLKWGNPFMKIKVGILPSLKIDLFPLIRWALFTVEQDNKLLLKEKKKRSINQILYSIHMDLMN